MILTAATVGKLGPAYAASRLCGIERRDAAQIAVLVNTRGLTELIALNLGLTDGLIGQRLFTILVLMALVTTMMTGPLLSVVGSAPPAAPAVPAESAPAPAGPALSGLAPELSPDPDEQATRPRPPR